MSMTRGTGLVLTVLLLVPVTGRTQGLMSGTGMQPSRQVATPPNTPAIDRPGAAKAARARRMPVVRKAPTTTPETANSGPR